MPRSSVKGAPVAGRTQSNGKAKLLVGTLSMLLGLGLAEAGLRFIEHRRAPDIGVVPDPKVGARFRPNERGLDANGYRNRYVPVRADIVTLGDSQTWGNNADLDSTWPSALQGISGHSVYNMSVGGWSVAQYSLLLSDALALRPRIVVVALYFGNDLWETYQSVYTLEALRLLRSSDTALDPDSDPVRAQAKKFWRAKAAFLDSYGRWPPTLWPGWFLRHTAIGRLGDHTAESLGVSEGAWFKAAAAWAGSDEGYALDCERGSTRTILTPRYRRMSVDLAEPRIREGLRLTHELMRAMSILTRTEHVGLLFIFLPTKERVYGECGEELHSIEREDLRTLLQGEDEVRTDLLSSCSEEGMRCLDLLPALRLAIDGGKQIYPRTEDGHPTAAGYSVIARAVADSLRSFPW